MAARAGGREAFAIAPASVQSRGLSRRILVTIGALLAYRLGLKIPVPGLEPNFVASLYAQHGSLIEQVVHWTSGGVLTRLSVFALGLMPYLTAAILIFLPTIFIPSLAAFRRTQDGRARLERWSVAATVPLALLQGWAIATALRESPTIVASEPVELFALTAGLVMAGGTMLLVWLAGQITRYGLGHGVAIILAVNVVAQLPQTVASEIELIQRGVAPGWEIFVGLAAILVPIGLASLLDGAERRVALDARPGAPRRDYAYLPLRLNAGGVVAAVTAIVAMSIVAQVPFRSLVDETSISGFWAIAIFQALVLFGFALLTAGSAIDSGEFARDLAASDARLPEAEAERLDAADFIDRAQLRLAVPLAAAMALIYLVPTVLYGYELIQVFVSGTSLIVLAWVGAEVVAVLRGRRSLA